jgi:hypothetical protein
MEAYDIKHLAEILKTKGLVLAEESAEILVESVFQWVEESAKLSATPYDDMALLVLPQIKGFVKKAVDKIDGQEG